MRCCYVYSSKTSQTLEDRCKHVDDKMTKKTPTHYYVNYAGDSDTRL